MPDNGTPTTEVKPKPERAIVPVTDDSEAAALLDTAKFDHLWRVASAFSRSDLVPEHFRGKPENCMIVVASALRSRVDPMLFMQHTYVVQGKLGIDGQIAIAMLNSRGGFKGGVKFKWTGKQGDKDWGCIAYGIDVETGETLEGPPITWETVEAEKWDSKNGSKWKTIPQLMFMYRAASWFGRTHRPEVLMGFPTEGEMEERTERNVTPEMPSDIAARASLETSPDAQPEPEPEPEGKLEADKQQPTDFITEQQAKVITDAAKAMGEMELSKLLDERGFKDLKEVTVEGFPLVLQDIIKARKAK